MSVDEVGVMDPHKIITGQKVFKFTQVFCYQQLFAIGKIKPGISSFGFTMNNIHDFYKRYAVQ